MKYSVVCVALLLGVAAAASAGEQSKAMTWMRMHQQPSQDELDELKNKDPNSYAIVKALLAKQSMGLLNMRHPSSQRASVSDDDQSSSMAAPEPHSSKNWLSWRPPSDDAAVSSVLGQVAGLTAGKIPPPSVDPSVDDSSNPTAGLLSSQTSVAKMDSAENFESVREEAAKSSLQSAAFAAGHAEAAQNTADYSTQVQQAQGGLQQMLADSADLGSSSGKSNPFMGVKMDWGSDDGASNAPKKQAPAQQTNPYLTEYPLSMAQASSPDDETPQAPDGDSFVASRMNRWAGLRKKNFASLRSRQLQKEQLALNQEVKKGKKPDYASSLSSGVNPYVVDLA